MLNAFISFLPIFFLLGFLIFGPIVYYLYTKKGSQILYVSAISSMLFIVVAGLTFVIGQGNIEHEKHLADCEKLWDKFLEVSDVRNYAIWHRECLDTVDLGIN